MAFENSEPTSGIDLSNMDKSVRPQDDFYRFMNGNWLKKYEIPADRSRYGVFGKLRDDAEINLRTIIEDAANAKDKPNGSNTQKVGDMYLSFMDSTKVEKLGIGPIRKELKAIEKLKSKKDIVKYAAYLEKMDINGPFEPFVMEDKKNTTQFMVYLYQGGLSLPDRDYYLKDDERFVNIRTEFLTHMEKMFAFAHIADGTAKAETILNIEKQLAEHQWTRVENRDPVKTYNKISRADLAKKMPNWDWKLYMKELGIAGKDSLVMYQPTYLDEVNKIFAAVSLEDWKTYYTWRVLTDAASLLSSEFVEENYKFFSETLRGTKQQRPRWKRGVSLVRGAMGEVLGEIYVERHFKPEAKERMQTMVDNLIAALGLRIDNLEWMSAETKVKAREKLAKFRSKIGYPDKWRDYTALKIKAGDLYGNSVRATVFQFNYRFGKLGKPIDPDEWVMAPQTVNAGYNPRMNDVTFPAAILQPPFFNLEADDAVNYGAIGAAIGHEITHGFDDSGRQYNGDGNIQDWWSEEDGKEFDARAQVMVDQFNEYNPIDSMHVNGELTLGENIADLGGLTVAYHAYKRSLNGKKSSVIDGYTGEQRFFLGFGQIWANKYRDEALRRQLMTDPHSPGEYRVNGTLANMPEFYEVFDVKEGDGLYRSETAKVKIW
ncbi:MAG: M13 family peptidase [Calditrichaeota bacterium]|nr:MAG: M13 family peptidase [Calditrichota bacterium]